MAEELERAEQTLIEKVVQPDWWISHQDDHRVGMTNVFIFTGNVWDYVEHPTTDLTLRQYLEARLSRTHTVASYAPDQGITFPGNELAQREARARFDAAIGVEPVAVDPSTAAVRAAFADPSAGGSDQEQLPQDAVGAISKLIEFVRNAREDDEAAQVGLVGPKGARTEIRKRAAVIIERADLIFPPEDKARLSPGDRALLALVHRAGTDIAINQGKNLVIILSPSLEEVHEDLRMGASNIGVVEIPMPNQDQRLAYVARTLVKRNATLDGITEVELANEAAGLSRRAIEDIAMRAAGRGGILTRDMVKARKAELIKSEYAECLEILEPDVTFDMVGGHERIKAYLRNRVLRTMRDPNLRKRCPMGILFAGPSGTGKTYLIRAIGYESGFNVVKFNPDNFRGSYVGESEKKVKKAIAGALALAPCLVFIDELDQKVRRVSGGGGGGDSVEGNIFGTLLEFLGDKSHQGQILFVAATNRPDNLDAAFKRPGRIDAKIPLLPPDSPSERAATLAALSGRHNVPLLPEADLAVVAEATDLWTQAELESLVETAGFLLDLDDLPERAEGDERPDVALAFEGALEETARSTDDIELHTKLAVAVCSNKTLVPDRYRDQVGKQLPKRKAAPVGTSRTAIESSPSDDDLFDFEDES
jgi:transitional endoplasmic reticulum ATPase